MQSVALIIDERDVGLPLTTGVNPLVRQRNFPVLQYISTDYSSLMRLCKEVPEPVVAIVPHFKQTVEELSQVFRTCKKQIILLDMFDQTSSPLLPLIDAVDVYAKRAVLRCRADYAREFRGGYIFTDWLVPNTGIQIGLPFGSIIPESLSQKLIPSWNFAGEVYFRKCRAAGKLFARSMRRRKIDVNCRFSIPHKPGECNWYIQYRELCLRKTKAVLSQFRLSKEDRIGRRAYFWELCNSKCTFSPFGFGELCLRDVEAICAGSLLIKPDVSHVETRPDLYVPFETYVPVAWDLSDLDERISYYLQRPDEAEYICRNASCALRDYHKQGWNDEVMRVFNMCDEEHAKESRKMKCQPILDSSAV